MTEIDKLFKNVGIKKQYCGWLDMGDLDCQPQYVRCNSITEWKDAVFSSRFGESEEEPEHKYPPFTAEKQLLLIQWLAKTRPIHISFLFDKWIIEGIVRYGNKYDTFEDALSGYINHIWQDLTNQEKEEIRGILNE